MGSVSSLNAEVLGSWQVTQARLNWQSLDKILTVIATRANQVKNRAVWDLEVVAEIHVNVGCSFLN